MRCKHERLRSCYDVPCYETVERKGRIIRMVDEGEVFWEGAEKHRLVCLDCFVEWPYDYDKRTYVGPSGRTVWKEAT